MIDFGLSHFSLNPEHKAVDLYVLERAIQSVHVGIDFLMDDILKGYAHGDQTSDNRQDSVKVVIEKLKEVRMRGRKRDMVG